MFSAPIYAAVGIFESIFAKEATFDLTTSRELCLLKFDGAKVCVTGDEMSALLVGAEDPESLADDEPNEPEDNGSDIPSDDTEPEDSDPESLTDDEPNEAGSNGSDIPSDDTEPEDPAADAAQGDVEADETEVTEENQGDATTTDTEPGSDATDTDPDSDTDDADAEPPSDNSVEQ